MATAAKARQVTLTRRYYDELQTRLATAEKRYPRTAATVHRGALTVKEDQYGITSIGIGALAMYASTMEAIKKNKTFKKYWWLFPALVLGFGLWLRRKQDKSSARYRYGSALLSTGGALLARAWNERPKKKDDEDEDAETKDTKGPEGLSSFGTSAGRLVLNAATGEYMFEPTLTAGNYTQPQPDPAQRMAERLYNTAA